MVCCYLLNLYYPRTMARNPLDSNIASSELSDILRPRVLQQPFVSGVFSSVTHLFNA